MNNARNHRQFDIAFECEEGRLDAEVRKKIGHFLKKISGPLKVYADKLVSEKDSVVAYLVKTTGNADITVEVNCTGDRPDPEIQGVNILPPDDIKKEGMTEYQVKCDEDRILDIEFTLQDVSCRVIGDYGIQGKT